MLLLHWLKTLCDKSSARLLAHGLTVFISWYCYTRVDFSNYTTLYHSTDSRHLRTRAGWQAAHPPSHLHTFPLACPPTSTDAARPPAPPAHAQDCTRALPPAPVRAARPRPPARPRARMRPHAPARPPARTHARMHTCMHAHAQAHAQAHPKHQFTSPDRSRG